jgi:predicted nucleotidyltransferase
VTQSTTSPKATKTHKLVAQASQETDVLAVILFGSVARGEQTAHSDVDICLVLTPERVRDKSVLSRKRLEYLAQFDLDVQIFQALPLYIRHRVLKEG